MAPAQCVIPCIYIFLGTHVGGQQCVSHFPRVVHCTELHTNCSMHNLRARAHRWDTRTARKTIAMQVAKISDMGERARQKEPGNGLRKKREQWGEGRQAQTLSNKMGCVRNQTIDFLEMLQCRARRLRICCTILGPKTWPCLTQLKDLKQT